MKCYQLVFGLLAVAFAQPAPRVEFEVASVKPTQHGRTADGSSHSSVGNSSPENFAATNANLQMLLVWAYDVKDYQISGPDWLNSDEVRFDITAKAPPGSSKHLGEMLQSLLAERFKIVLHRETRTLPIYALTAAKNGPKLHESPGDGRNSRTNEKGGRMTAEQVSMTDLAAQLSRRLGRAVVDETGIKGAFDFTLEFAEDDADTTRPSIFTALQEQLGLKLEATKGPVEMLIVDHAEKVPTEN